MFDFPLLPWSCPAVWDSGQPEKSSAKSSFSKSGHRRQCGSRKISDTFRSRWKLHDETVMSDRGSQIYQHHMLYVRYVWYICPTFIPQTWKWGRYTGIFMKYHRWGMLHRSSNCFRSYYLVQSPCCRCPTPWLVPLASERMMRKKSVKTC